MDYYTFITSYFSVNLVVKIVRIIFIVIIGIPLVTILTSLIKKIKADFISDHVRFLLARGVWYAGISFLGVILLSELGFHIGTLLGAAGIAGAAIGFASQTSLSNIISGIFLLSERSFSVGDAITISGITGTVVAIDLLSVKLKQFNGTYVRIPHEQLIKNSLINLSYFDLRRIDLRITIAFKEDLARVTELIQDVISSNAYAVQKKEPLIMCDTFQESGPSFFVGVWAKKSDYINLKKTILVDIKNRFKAEGIEIPLPQRVVSMKETKV